MALIRLKFFAGHEKLERQVEAGELLGLQRLYVCTALSSQPNGGLAEPLRVCSIPSLCLAWHDAFRSQHGPPFNGRGCMHISPIYCMLHLYTNAEAQPYSCL